MVLKDKIIWEKRLSGRESCYGSVFFFFPNKEKKNNML